MVQGPERWWLQVPGWLLLTYLVYAQAIPAFDYELGVRMGTQESIDRITEVGAAFWYVLGAALGITVYWPVVVMATAVDARDASGWAIDETAYWIVLPIITAWALWGLFAVARKEGKPVAE